MPEISDDACWESIIPGCSVALRFASAVLVISVFTAAIGCGPSSMTLHIPRTEQPAASGKLMAGAARVDITPLPGYPTCGSGPEGRIARGVWNRLYAHAIYLEDRRGDNLAMVSCDLWSMTGGLADRVADILSREDSIPVGRDHIILSGTHTHLGPGNYTSWEIFNSFGSPLPGFDQTLFEFLAHRIARSIALAFNSRKEAVLSYGISTVDTLSRNRSFDAFLQNPECREILRENATSQVGAVTPEYPDTMAYHAVDPHLRILRIDPANEPGAMPIAIAAFYAVHPNAMGGEPEVYSSDIFGVAEAEVLRRIDRGTPGNGPQPVVAIFNGAEGDISSVWVAHGRKTTLKLGTQLASAIVEESRSCKPCAIDTIAFQYGLFTFAGVCLTDSEALPGIEPGRTICTDDQAIPGDPLLGGAEDSRTFLYALGFREGVKGDRDSRQAPKQLAFNPRFLSGWKRTLVSLATEAERNQPAPRLLPLGVYRVGPLAFVTLPGECTTTLGRRISQSLHRVLAGVDDVVNIGLANEYLLYFSTPEEYEVQDYEGAGTLYGGASGPLLTHYLTKLAQRIGQPHDALPAEVTYLPGPSVTFDIASVGVQPSSIIDGLPTIFIDTGTGLPARNLPRVIWNEESVPSLTDLQRSPSAYPRVWLERDDGEGHWKAIAGEDNEGLDFVTLVLKSTKKGTEWAAIWLVPGNLDATQIMRFSIQDRAGNVLHSCRFTTKEIADGTKQPLIEMEPGCR